MCGKPYAGWCGTRERITPEDPIRLVWSPLGLIPRTRTPGRKSRPTTSPFQECSGSNLVGLDHTCLKYAKSVHSYHGSFCLNHSEASDAQQNGTFLSRVAQTLHESPLPDSNQSSTVVDLECIASYKSSQLGQPTWMDSD